MSSGGSVTSINAGSHIALSQCAHDEVKAIILDEAISSNLSAGELGEIAAVFNRLFNGSGELNELLRMLYEVVSSLNLNIQEYLIKFSEGINKGVNDPRLIKIADSIVKRISECAPRELRIDDVVHSINELKPIYNIESKAYLVRLRVGKAVVPMDIGVKVIGEALDDNNANALRRLTERINRMIRPLGFRTSSDVVRNLLILVRQHAEVLAENPLDEVVKEGFIEFLREHCTYVEHSDSVPASIDPRDVAILSRGGLRISLSMYSRLKVPGLNPGQKGIVTRRLKELGVIKKRLHSRVNGIQVHYYVFNRKRLEEFLGDDVAQYCRELKTTSNEQFIKELFSSAPVMKQEGGEDYE